MKGLSHLSWSVLKIVLRSCFTAWRSASLPSAERDSEYAAPFPSALSPIKPAVFGFAASGSGRLLESALSACFRAGGLLLAKPARVS